MAKCVDLLPICHTYVKKLITGLSCMYSKRNKCLICCWIHNFEHSVYNFLFCDGINPLPVLCGKIIFDSHPKNIQTWQWKHYVLGVFFCQYYKIPASHWGKKMEKSWIRMSFTQPGHWKCIVGGPSHKTVIQNILQSQKLKKTPAKDETESWSFVSPNHNLKALRISTRSAKISAWQRLLYQVVNLSSSYFSLWNSH